MDSHNNTRNPAVTEASLNAAPINGNSYITKSKKRSRDDESNKTVDNDDNDKSKPSKEERRQAKRLRKLIKKSDTEQRYEESLSKSTEANIIEKIVANRSKIVDNLSKEARKKVKRSQKLSREHKNVPSIVEYLPVIKQVSELYETFKQAN